MVLVHLLGSVSARDPLPKWGGFYGGPALSPYTTPVGSLNRTVPKTTHPVGLDCQFGMETEVVSVLTGIFTPLVPDVFPDPRDCTGLSSWVVIPY